MQRADELVARYILDDYRAAGRDRHLRECPETQVTDPDAYDGQYGCDTGCEYVRFAAVLKCPHGHEETYEYGEFGELDYILDKLEP